MAQVRPLRPHTFRIDNCVIDDYAAEMGAMGVALYAVLQRYADRETGQCWPSVATMAATLRLSQTAVKKYLRHLAQLGLISIASRYTAAGDHSSNLYTVHDPTKPEALLRRRRQRRGGSCGDGGGSCSAPPALPVGHLATHRGSSRVQEQGSKEQDLTTAHAPNTAEHAVCNTPLHEHCTTVPGLRICLDCFRSWQVPLAVISPSLDTEVG